MEKTKSRLRVLALAGLFALVTIASTMWVGITTREDASVALITKRDVSSQTRLASVSQVDGARTASVTAPVEPGRSASTATLTIHCVDDATGTDLPGLTWSVGVGSDEVALVASGTTDALGRATLRDPPGGTLQVMTLRSPPHATAFTASIWKPGESRTIELRVGTGARVKGRVLDDLAAPLADAEILVSDDCTPPFTRPEDTATSSKVAAHTDAAGEYTVDCVASRPYGVWVVEGDVRVGYWRDLVVTARRAGVSGVVTTPVAPGDIKVVSDIVLPRRSTWRGRVVDASGRGVEGVLLTTSMRRIGKLRHAFGKADVDLLPPGATGFALLPGETLTGPNGEFEVSNGNRFFMPTLVTRSGATQAVSLPTLEPGQSADGLVITLKDASSFVLELVDELGAPARVPNPRVFENGTNVQYGAPRFFEPLRLVVELADGDTRRADLHDDGVGGFSAQIDGRVEDARNYSLWASGWSRASAAISPPLLPGARLRVVLDQAPCVRVHVKMHDLPADVSERELPSVAIEACLLSPDVKAAGKSGCCGLGSHAGITLATGERDLLLPVEARRPFHVYTCVYANDRASPIVDHGLGSPDGAVVVIDLDGSALPVAEPDKPPMASAPGTAPGTGSVRVTVVNAADGKPLKQVGLDLESQGKRAGAYFTNGNAAKGELLAERVPVGEWTGVMRALGCRNRTDLRVSVRSGETTDLGRIVLEPAPRARFVILEPDGTRVPKFGAGVRFWDVAMNTLFATEGIVQEDGIATLYGDVPEELTVQIVEDFPALQLLHVRRDPDETTVRLAPWRVVDVRVGGIALTLPGASLDLDVRPESADPDPSKVSVPRKFISACRPKELETPDGSPRLFRCRLGPGTYVVQGQSPLFHVPSRTFEVGAGDGPVRVDVESSE